MPISTKIQPSQYCVRLIIDKEILLDKSQFQWNLFIFISRLLITMRNSKKNWATIDGYSRTCKYTETYFHHPTRGRHYQTQFEKKMGNKQAQTFRQKKNPQYKELLYTSSLNIIPPKTVRHDTIGEGQKRRIVPNHSFKETDPISLRHQFGPKQPRQVAPFECSFISKADVERRFLLPVQRKISRSLRHYHSQLGFSSSVNKRIIPRQVINNSSTMRSSIQYSENPLTQTIGTFDDFKYNSRK